MIILRVHNAKLGIVGGNVGPAIWGWRKTLVIMICKAESTEWQDIDTKLSVMWRALLHQGAEKAL